MQKEAKFDARCSECGGKITAGEQMEYLPRSGDYPALTTHIVCPGAKPTKVRGVNHAPRVDPETVFLERECDDCGTPWWIKRTSLASRRDQFTGSCCDGSNGMVSLTVNAAHKGKRNRHLSVVA